MHTVNHRRNHDFQIAYFLAGRCHTPDGAYAMLCDLREERESAIASHRSNRKRAEAKRLRSEQKLQSADLADQLEAQADLDDLVTGAATGEVLFDAAVAELEFIQRCIVAVHPHRMHRHLPDQLAHEATQHEEWRLELISRAENFLACQGSIPADEFVTMRSHPAFAGSILPAIDKIRASLEKPDTARRLMEGRPGLMLTWLGLDDPKARIET